MYRVIRHTHTKDNYSYAYKPRVNHVLLYTAHDSLFLDCFCPEGFVDHGGRCIEAFECPGACLLPPDPGFCRYV